MKGYKEIIKKLGAVTLALAMTATMMPGQVLAEESAPADQAEAEDPAASETAEGEAAEDRAEAETADTVPGDGVQGASEQTDADAGSENVSGNAGESSEGDVADAASDTADINDPVIEKVELVQQGETLHEGDAVEVRVDAYDADSGIESVYVELEEDSATGSERLYLYPEYDEELDCYVATTNLPHAGNGSVHINDVEVVDNNSNYVNAEIRSDEGDYLYWFNTENDVNTIEALSVDFPKGQVVTPEEEQDIFKLQLPESKLGEYSVNVEFATDNGSTGNVNLGYQIVGETGIYSNYTLPSYLSNGTYTVKSVKVERLGEDMQVQINDLEQYSFTYQRDEQVPEEDTENPVITSISVDKNKEIVRAGDQITVTVKAEDNAGLDEYGSAYFNAVSDIVSGSEYVNLTYSEELQAYTGVFEVTEDTYPCEWYISDISVYDTSGNGAEDWRFLSDQDYPYYVQVYTGNTFDNPVYDLTFYFMTLSESGVYVPGEEVSVKAERRQTLEEIGFELPEIESEYEGFNFTGWVTYDGTPIDADEEIVSSAYTTAYAAYDQILVNVSYLYLDENGQLADAAEKIVVPFGATYGELYEKAFEKECPDGYSGLEFTGWKGSHENDEPVRPVEAYEGIEATYSTMPVNASYEYIDADGNWKESSKLYTVPKDTTFGELRSLLSEYMPEDMTSEYPFDTWEYNGNDLGADDEVIWDSIGRVYDATAKYEGKTIILLDFDYYDAEGRGMNTQDYMPVAFDEDVVWQDVQDYINNMELPEMFEGLRFAGWDSYYYGENLVNGVRIGVSAAYENCMVRYLLDPRCADLENLTAPLYDDGALAVFGQVAEPGDTITIPGSFEGYEDVIYWGDYQAGDTFTVSDSVTFYGYTEEMLTDPGEPEEPGTDPGEPEEPGTDPGEPEEPGTDPGEPENPGTDPDDPAVELPDDSVSNIVDMVEEASEGENVTVDMGNATVVPKEVLEAAQGKDVTVELKMNGYTWTINGKDISAKNLKDINLEVTLNSDAIPSDTVKKLAGDNPVEQLSLTHNGDFGFRADLTINVGSDHAGKYGNLYYYDSTGRMVFMNAGTINEDGSVSLSFSHASDYVVVISEKEMSQSDVPEDLQPTDDGSQSSGQDQNSGNGAVKTGDMSPVFPTVIVLILAAAVIAGVAAVRKRQR